jgi:hypothetical protein
MDITARFTVIVALSKSRHRSKTPGFPGFLPGNGAARKKSRIGPPPGAKGLAKRGFEGIKTVQKRNKTGAKPW